MHRLSMQSPRWWLRAHRAATRWRGFVGIQHHAGGARMTYPPSFSSEVQAHCEAGCVPAEVFANLSESRHQHVRCVRVHPMAVAGLCRSGDEVLRGYHYHLTDGAGSHGLPHSDLVEVPESWTSRLVGPNAMEALAARFCLRERVKCGLQRQLGLTFREIQEITWLPCFCYNLPRHLSMASHPLFKDGTLIPMDAASIAGVVALGARPGDRVLDMCCSPGMKLNCLVDAVLPVTYTLDPQPDVPADDGIVVGVDINVERQYVARAIVGKHANAYQRAARPAPCAALFAADGCHFSLRDAISALDQPDGQKSEAAVVPATGLTAREKRRLQAFARQDRKRFRDRNATADPDAAFDSEVRIETTPPVLPVFCPAPARTRLVNLTAASATVCEFDRVLVDAECTHDGSLSHLSLGPADNGSAGGTAEMEKDSGGLTNHYRMRRMNVAAEAALPPSARCGSPSIDARTRPALSSALLNLQLGLLHAGFTQLRVGGTLVYSTCSFSFLQNEYVVWRFLRDVNSALKDDPHSAFRAVPVSPFTYAHEKRSQGSVDVSCFAPTGYDEVALSTLQMELDGHATDYGVRLNGVTRYCGDLEEVQREGFITGSRLWPHHQCTSFQYIAKIWKQPYPPPTPE